MKILVPVDFSKTTPMLMVQTRVQAVALKAEVILLHVALPEPFFVGYQPGPPSVRKELAREFHEEHQQLQDLAAVLRNLEITAQALMVQGPTAEAILSEAKRLEVDLIIIGSHGHGAMYHLLLGSVGEGVLKGATVPVLVVPAVTKDQDDKSR